MPRLPADAPAVVDRGGSVADVSSMVSRNRWALSGIAYSTETAICIARATLATFVDLDSEVRGSASMMPYATSDGRRLAEGGSSVGFPVGAYARVADRPSRP